MACQLLFRLLDQSPDNSDHSYTTDTFSCEPTPDRALLRAAQENVQVSVIFDVLKAIMKFSEAESSKCNFGMRLMSQETHLYGFN